MVGAAVYSGLVLADIEETKANTKTIEVTGEQFAWTFEYQDRERPSGRAAPREGHAVPLQAPRQGRAALVLGAAVPDEEGRRARHHDRRPRHADPQRPLLARLRGAVRPRPLDDARAVVVEDQAAFDRWAGSARRAARARSPAASAPQEDGGPVSGHDRADGASLTWPAWRSLPREMRDAASPAAAGLDPGGLGDARGRGVRFGLVVGIRALYGTCRCSRARRS